MSTVTVNETEYRAHTLHRDVRQTTWVVGSVLAVVLGTLPAEYRLFHETFGFVIWVRLTVVIASVAVLRFAQSRPTPRHLDVVVTAWFAVVLACFSANSGVRPAHFEVPAAFYVLLVMVLHLLAPAPARGQIALGIVGSGGDFLIWAFYKHVDRPALVAIGAAYLVANVLGIMGAREIRAGRRREFTLLSEERSMRSKLEEAQAEIKVLQGLIPICSFCKSIRNEEGSYEAVETYVPRSHGADFTHTICPDCLEKNYPS